MTYKATKKGDIKNIIGKVSRKKFLSENQKEYYNAVN